MRTTIERAGKRLRLGGLRWLLAAPLAGLPLQAQSVDDQLEGEWYLPVGGGCRLYVRELGTGSDTVVVLHGGFGADHSYLLPGFRPLLGRHRFVFYDQRGSLRSPCADSTISLAAHLEDLERLRAELRLEHMKLAAHSMGTFLAMSYLQQHPDRVANLALLGALPPSTAATREDSALVLASDSAFSTWRQRPEVEAIKRREGLPLTGELSARQTTQRWRIDFTAANAFHVERWRQMTGGQVFYSARAGSLAGRTVPKTYDFRSLLAGHSCPVTIIIGDHDLVDMGAVRHRRWTASAPSVRLVVVRDAGHVAWIDAPQQFGAALERALASRSASCP